MKNHTNHILNDKKENKVLLANKFNALTGISFSFFQITDNVLFLLLEIISLLIYRSQPATAEKVKEAVEEVKNMKSNMGGTEILSPLRDILQSKDSVKEYPRQVCLFVKSNNI